MSDKPLAEQWWEESKRCKQIAQERRDDSVFAQSVRYWMCANELEQFAAEHLTEQTEPDQSLLRDIEYMLTHSGYCPSVGTIAEMIRDVVNAERRRIRELLVGKERP